MNKKVAVTLTTVFLLLLATGCGSSSFKAELTGKPVLDNLHPSPNATRVPRDTEIRFDLYNGSAYTLIYWIDEQGTKHPISRNLYIERHTNYRRYIYSPTKLLPSNTEIFVEIRYHNSQYSYRKLYSFWTE